MEEENIIKKRKIDVILEIMKTVVDFLKRIKIDKIIAIFILVLVVYVIGYYIIFPSKWFFHSDNTDTILWAEASINAGAIYNSDFMYAGLLPFGGNLIMLLYIPFFGVSMTAHILGMLTFFIIFFVALYHLCRSMEWKIGWISFTIITTVLILSGSEKLREIMWGHIIYYSLGILFFIVGLIFVFKYLKNIGNIKKMIIYASISFVWVLLCSLNGIQALMIFVIPVVGGITLEYFLDTKQKIFSKNIIPYMIIIVIYLIGMGCGSYISAKISSGIIAGYAGAYSSFDAPHLWFSHFESFFTSWLTLLGVDIQNGESMSNLKSMINIIKILMGLILLIVPIIATINYKKIVSKENRIIILANLLMTILLMIGWVFGRLSAANWRLTPLVFFATFTSIIYAKEIYNTNTKRISGLIIVPIILVSIFNIITIKDLPKEHTQGSRYDIYMIKDVLESNNLTYGYATFWRANSMTIISDSSILVRGITTTTKIQPYHYQSQLKWYDDQEGQVKYFLLLTQSEYNTVRYQTNFPLTDHIIETINFQGLYDTYVVVIIDQNINFS